MRLRSTRLTAVAHAVSTAGGGSRPWTIYAAGGAAYQSYLLTYSAAGTPYTIHSSVVSATGTSYSLT